MTATWRALIAGAVFRYASVALLLRELSRNPALLDLCGFHPIPRKVRRRHGQDPETGVIHVIEPREQSSVPSGCNMSRFLVCLIRLEEEEGLTLGHDRRVAREADGADPGLRRSPGV